MKERLLFNGVHIQRDGTAIDQSKAFTVSVLADSLLKVNNASMVA
jgi:hypothetical protein